MVTRRDTSAAAKNVPPPITRTTPAKVLIELEVWPNFLGECRKRGVPVGVINGRLSARSFRDASPRCRIAARRALSTRKAFRPRDWTDRSLRDQFGRKNMRNDSER